MNPIGFFLTRLRNWYLIRFVKKVCKKQSIVFSYKIEVRDAEVINDIFFKRVYANAFPFYQNCNIIDIGAHKGYFSLFASRYAGLNAKILSIEPEPSNFNSMVQNIKHNKMENISAFQCAISNETGKQQLFLSETVNHSLVKVDVKHPYIKQDGSIEVDTYSLKDFMKKNSISKVDFLKIDCEGAEYEILFNTDDETFSNIKTIALEFHDIADPDNNIYTLTNFLYQKGYQQLSIIFQDTPMPLNMGILTVSRMSTNKSI